MNKRIEELARQATKDVETRPDTGICSMEKYNARFAELIVQECIGVLNKRYMGDNNREDFEVRRCVEDLKKHFGVK